MLFKYSGKYVKIYFNMKITYYSKIQEEGVPQASVLSVILFAVAIKGISSVIHADVMLTLFADDLKQQLRPEDPRTAPFRRHVIK